MKYHLLSFANRLIAPTGMQLVKRSMFRNLENSRMTDNKLEARLVDELAEVGSETLNQLFGEQAPSREEINLEIAGLLKLLRRRQLSLENQGGSGFHNSFWIDLVCKTLQPGIVVESGVWKGHTSWLLEAVNPEAAVYGFDIDISRLEHRGKIHFHQHDWSRFDFGEIDPERSLAFFDCHINHAQRIIEAKEKGFRHLLFDDNPPIHKLYGYRLPGFPTAAMLVDDLCPLRGKIEWKSSGADVSYTIDPKQFEEARALIDTHHLFPDVGHIANFGGYSFLSYVRLK